MSNYMAITLGPIYKTFENVRKTREIWAASYIFSFISKRLIEYIRTIDKTLIIVPSYDPDSLKGIGLYPDRIFLKKSDVISVRQIEDAKNSALDEVATWINNQNAKKFLSAYFRIYSVEYSTGINENPLLAGNNLLDTAELRNSWEQRESLNLLLNFFRSVNTLKVDGKKWISDHFEEKDVFGEVRFESIPEISTRDIRHVNPAGYRELVKKYCYQSGESDEDEENLMMEMKNLFNKRGKPEVFKNYHKYICVVKADGDKVGKYIKAIRGDYEKELKNLSASLFKWGDETAKLILGYGGTPIYIGGDDVLFLAPVVGHTNDNIVELLATVNDSFVRCFSALPLLTADDVQIKPTLSFGVSITYYKFPLSEALMKADQQLHRAKINRNTCCISLVKHSGSSFEIELPNSKTDPVRNAYLDAGRYFTEDSAFVSSIIHHFRQNTGVYRIIGNDRDRVSNFLKKNFEDIKHEDFVNSVANLCYEIYTVNNGCAGNEESEKSTGEIYNFLRILKFLNGQEDGK